MSVQRSCAVGLVIMTLAACPRSQESSTSGREEASDPKEGTRGGAPAASGAKGTSYEVDVKLPERYACDIDDDCDASTYSPGSCCPARCLGNRPSVGTRAWVAAVEQLRRRSCAGVNIQECPRDRCDSRQPRCARCVDGRCTRIRGSACKREETDHCSAAKEAFKRVLAKASGTCNKDQDCAFYPIWVDCGRVTDRLTADRLRKIRERFRKLGCPKWFVRCAPRVRGKAVCEDGHCLERKGGPGLP